MVHPRRLVFALAALTAASAMGQGWPLPAKAPNTAVNCVSKTTACLGKEDKKLAGYPAVFKTFTGRFLDSVASRDYQYSFRTARARMIKIAPERNRIYMILGSALAAYDLRTFFGRLDADEPLFLSTDVPVSPTNTRAGSPETFLKWDAFFYAESGGGWLTQGGDGQERLFGFDWDDRGNVYLAYGAYSWGIVKDDGGATGERMASLYQHTKAAVTDETDVARVYSLKSGSTYYAVVSGKYPRINLFNVNNPAAPVKVRDTLDGPITEMSKNADGTRIAIVKGDGSFSIYSTATFVAGGAPLLARDITDGSFGSVTTDGTNFFAGIRDPDGKMVIAAYSPSGTAYAEKRFALNVPLAAGVTIRYGAGFITSSGVEIPPGAFNLRLFRVDGLQPIEVPLFYYYSKHYSVAAPQAGLEYTYPAYSVLLDTVVHQSAGKYYMLMANFGLGDVYELDTTKFVLPPPSNVTADARTTSRVDISWAPVPAATTYVVERKGEGGDFVLAGTTSDAFFTDRGLPAEHAYLYRVRATNELAVSAWGPTQLATTIDFSDSPLTRGIAIKAIHMTELRIAVDTVRRLAGLGPFNYTDSLRAGSTIMARHLTELRTALDEADQVLGLPVGGFTDASPRSVAEKAIHLQQLRDRVQ